MNDTRVALLSLSGDGEKAGNLLAALYPNASIVPLSRTPLESGSMMSRLKAVRREHPDVFAVATESLWWQYGQDALMLLGALAGAAESIILDSHGNTRVARQRDLIVMGPPRVAKCFARGKIALSQARKKLDVLERQVDGHHPEPRINDPDKVTCTYLRSTPAAGTQPGGATSHINGVVKALLSLGTRLSFISNDEILGLDRDQLPFHIIPPDSDVMPRAAFDTYNGMRFSDNASQLIGGAPPDFIYQRYSRFSWPGVEASLRSGAPLFLEYNGSEVWIGKNWDGTAQLDLLERCERLNLKAANRIFVVSEVERQNLIDSGVLGDKIVVNPNGVDPEMFRPNIGGKSVRNELQIPSDTTLVGFVGTFGPWHGVLALAEAIAQTPRNAKIHFLLVGDGSLRGQVEERLRESGDLDRVTFAGVVSHERVPVMLDACDILVSPHVPFADGSAFFGSPTKLFEYMAAGKAIVASRLGQIGEVLTDNETALLVEPGDVNELSSAFLRLANDRELIARLGQAARQSAITHHTWQSNAQRILDELRG